MIETHKGKVHPQNKNQFHVLSLDAIETFLPLYIVSSKMQPSSKPILRNKGP